MDFHLQSSKMETSRGCGTRAEPHSKSKKQEEDTKCALGAQIPLLFLHHMVPSPTEFLTHGITEAVRDLWRCSPCSELGWLPHQIRLLRAVSSFPSA